MMLISVNPATGEKLQEYPELTPEQIDQKLRQADTAFREWRKKPFCERGELLQKAAALLRQNEADYAECMVLEMGKPIREACAEIQKCAWVCEYYAEHAAQFLQEERIRTDARKSYVAFRPLGVVLAIMPWNFPFWQVFRFAAPALMAGNVCALKHAESVPGCALAIERIFKDAGYPPATFTALLVDKAHAASLIAHPAVQAVTLTGSTRAGIAVAQQAGALLKKTVLELGGSDPALILEDADIEAAVQNCVTSRLINGGQSCIAAKRFIVPAAVRERFTDLLLQEMRGKTYGDPRDAGSTIGPMARFDLRDALHDQVVRSVAQGARCLLGGEIPEGPGAFYPPTVLTDIRPGMAAFDEELFGPVAAVVPAQDEAEAIRLANQTRYGLGASVFTRDRKRGEHIARDELEAGSCFVNSFVKSDPRLPFGGIKQSGYGRELSSYGIKEFVNIKTIYIA